MTKFTTAALSAVIALVSLSAPVAQATSATTTRAQMHTTNNLNRYQKTTTQHMSQYQRTACHKKGGVVVKTKQSGSLVCMFPKK